MRDYNIILRADDGEKFKDFLDNKTLSSYSITATPEFDLLEFSVMLEPGGADQQAVKDFLRHMFKDCIGMLKV